MANIFQQGISFKSVADFIDFLPDEERVIVEALREVIFEEIDGVNEKLSYNVPFYSKRKTMCFIWPGSIPWGGTKEGVVLGFTKGHLLFDDGYLKKGKRKFVYTKTYFKLQDIDFGKLRTLLSEVEIIDRSH